MTSIQGRDQPCKNRISKTPSKLSLSARLDYKSVVSPIIDSATGFVRSFVAKYIEKNLQQFLKTVLKAQVLFSDEFCEKFLKARLSDVYCSKSHIEYYNFCQQCEDHFAAAKAKGSNYILFAVLFFCNHINFQ